VLTLFTYESIGQDPPTEPPDPDLLLSSSQPKPMYYWAVASGKAAPDGRGADHRRDRSRRSKANSAWATSSTRTTAPEFAVDALYTFEGWLNNLITLARHCRRSGLWDRRRMDLVDRRMMVGGHDLLYKLEHGYHGARTQCQRPQYALSRCLPSSMSSVPTSRAIPTDPEQLIEGTPLEKGFVYDREIWDKLVQGPRQ